MKCFKVVYSNYTDFKNSTLSFNWRVDDPKREREGKSALPGVCTLQVSLERRDLRPKETWLDPAAGKRLFQVPNESPPC